MQFPLSRLGAVLIVFSLLLVAAPAHAKSACFGKKEALTVMADTGVKSSEGVPLVLAHKTTRHCFLLPYWLSDDGFVLSIKGDDKAYYPLPNNEKTSALQAAGLLPKPFPKWTRSLDDWIGGYFVWWFLLGCLIYQGAISARKSSGKSAR